MIVRNEKNNSAKVHSESYWIINVQALRCSKEKDILLQKNFTISQSYSIVLSIGFNEHNSFSDSLSECTL